MSVALFGVTPPALATFTHSVTQQAVRVHTTDWQAPSISFYIQKADGERSLAEQVRIEDFVLTGTQDIQQEVSFSQPPLGISFWLQYSGEVELVPEMQLQIFLDEDLLYQLSPAQVVSQEPALIHIPFTAPVVGLHTLRFVSTVPDDSKVHVTDVSTARAFLAVDMQLFARVEDSTAIPPTATQGEWQPFQDTVWQYQPNSKDNYSFVTVVKDSVGNTTTHSQFFWQPDSQLDSVTLTQEATPTEVHALVNTGSVYAWSNPLWLTAPRLLHDTNNAFSPYSIKRYHEPESVWVDTTTPLAVMDMFGNIRDLGLLSLQE